MKHDTLQKSRKHVLFFLLRASSVKMTLTFAFNKRKKKEESTRKGFNYLSKYVTQAQLQRPESPTVTLTWHACKYKVLHQKYSLN